MREKEMIQIRIFKEKGKEGGEGKPQLGGQWKVPSLMAIEMKSMFGSQWGIILLGGQWKVPSLVPLECSMFDYLWKEKKKSFSPPFIFHPTRFYLNFFSNYFRVLFYHGSRPLLHIFPSFSLAYKLQSRILRY